METRAVLGQPARSFATVDAYLWTLSGAAAGVLVAAAIGIWRDAESYRTLEPARWLLLAALMVGSYLVLTHLMLFDWRGQRVALGPDEVLMFLALAALPPTAAVLFAVPTMALYQVKTRRPFLRAASNVSVVTLASAACAVTFVVLGALVPWVLAATIAIVVYTFTTHLLVSAVFALRESASVLTVFGERFWVPTLLHIALGVSGGLAVIGLWAIHPAALAALVPFAYLAKEHVALSARRERESLVATRLSEMTRELAGEKSIDAVAQRVLATCGDIFHAGRVVLVVGEPGTGRQWSRDFDGGWRAGEAPLAASFPGTRGALLVHRNHRANEPFADLDRTLLSAVAGSAASAVANALALRELDAARARLEALLANANEAVLLLRTDGSIQYANPAGHALFALGGTGVGKARDLFEEADFLTEAARGRAEGQLYATWARTQRGRMPVEVSAARLRDDPTTVLAVVRDTSERRAAEAALLSQRVARPLVRRIVRGLMVETRADAIILMRLGEELAGGLETSSLESATRAYLEMGLGALELVSGAKGRYEFHGRDLFERTEGARATTCYLALGFLCGVVSRAQGGAPARGAEVACESRGDHECRFVVNVRAPQP